MHKLKLCLKLLLGFYQAEKGNIKNTKHIYQLIDSKEGLENLIDDFKLVHELAFDLAVLLLLD